MTKAEQFEALALRCEQATGMDRRLDAEIDCLARFPDLRPAELDDHKEYQRGFPPHAGNIWCPTGFLLAPSYTDSVDAALTLVPEGMRPSVGQNVHHGYWHAFVQSIVDSTPHQLGVADSNTSGALALCAAALRARAQMERGE